MKRKPGRPKGTHKYSHSSGEWKNHLRDYRRNYMPTYRRSKGQVRDPFSFFPRFGSRIIQCPKCGTRMRQEGDYFVCPNCGFKTLGRMT